MLMPWCGFKLLTCCAMHRFAPVECLCQDFHLMTVLMIIMMTFTCC